MEAGIAREYTENLEAIKEAKKRGQNVDYAVEVLFDYISKKGITGETLNDIAKSLLAIPPNNKEDQATRNKLTPETLLDSDFLIDKINHWIELIRIETWVV